MIRRAAGRVAPTPPLASGLLDGSMAGRSRGGRTTRVDRSRRGPARHDRLPTPASQAPLLRCATVLGRPLPADLAALLRESNGIEGEYGAGLIWSAERIVSENRARRADSGCAALSMPFDPLLFFADTGNGDLFALLSGLGRPDVFIWNHENDSRTWVAPSLAEYLEGWLTGRITV